MLHIRNYVLTKTVDDFEHIGLWINITNVSCDLKLVILPYTILHIDKMHKIIYYNLWDYFVLEFIVINRFGTLIES